MIGKKIRAKTEIWQMVEDDSITIKEGQHSNSLTEITANGPSCAEESKKIQVDFSQSWSYVTTIRFNTSLRASDSCRVAKLDNTWRLYIQSRGICPVAQFDFLSTAF